jgi:succinate-acetate transporter protein
MTVGTIRSSVAFFGLFFTLTMAFLMLAIGFYLNKNLTWIKIGGWFGLITAMFAWYNAVAGVWNAGNSYITLPLGKFPWAEQVGRRPHHA